MKESEQRLEAIRERMESATDSETFIASAQQDIPWLIDQLASAQAEIERLKASGRQAEPMTIEEACAVLNERKHRAETDWIVDGGEVIGGREYYGYAIDRFEAIAIAEKYTRKEGTDAK